MADAAIGLRDHSGWAAAVAVAGGDRPRVVQRRRFELCDPELPRQAYHAAVGLDLDEASLLIASVERSAVTLAARELADLTAALAEDGHVVRVVGVRAGTAPVPDDLVTILRSHPMLHAAEGELYREALVDAAALAGVPVVRFGAKEVLIEAAAALGIAPAALRQRLAELGHGLGPPWAADQKQAAAAALLALSGRAGGGT